MSGTRLTRKVTVEGSKKLPEGSSQSSSSSSGTRRSVFDRLGPGTSEVSDYKIMRILFEILSVYFVTEWNACVSPPITWNDIKKTAVVISFVGAKVSQSDSFNVESKEEFTSNKLVNNMCVCVCVWLSVTI